VTAFRSAVYGTCALDGRHPPGSKYAAECPLASRQKRSEAEMFTPTFWAPHNRPLTSRTCASSSL